MYANRQAAIEQSRSARVFGIIQGTLGRQGNPLIVERMASLIERAGGTYIIVLLSEISPQKLALFKDVDAWIQVRQFNLHLGLEFPACWIRVIFA